MTKSGLGRNRAVDRGHGVADEALQFMQRALIVSERGWRRACQFKIESIVHGRLSVGFNGIQPLSAPGGQGLLAFAMTKMRGCSYSG